MKVKQESFHAHFADSVHSGEGDWEVRVIDQLHSTENLRKRESFSHGLNEHAVVLF